MGQKVPGRRQPWYFYPEAARIDVDGTLVETTGERKQGMAQGVLLRYWQGEMATGDALELLMRV